MGGIPNAEVVRFSLHANIQQHCKAGEPITKRGGHLFDAYSMLILVYIHLFSLYNLGPAFDSLEGSEWQGPSDNKIK